MAFDAALSFALPAAAELSSSGLQVLPGRTDNHIATGKHVCPMKSSLK